MKLVDGIDIDQKYPIEQILKWYHAGRLKKIQLVGYIVRADADGLVGFVPWTESTLFRSQNEGLSQYGLGTLAEDMRKDVERENPMVRRTAQQKKASMVRRLLETCQRYGTVPGMTDEQISAMIGERWQTGVSVVTAQMLERVSAHYLGVGETMNKEADSKRVTRAHPLA